MCGCTKKIAARSPAIALPRRTANWASSRALSAGSPTFEYTGHTAMTAVGRITGRPYRFASPGARVIVDRRDRMSLEAVPNLRLIKS
jgi:hypothetical protein